MGIAIVIVGGVAAYFYVVNLPAQSHIVLKTTQLAKIPDSYYQAMMLTGGVAQISNGLSFSPDGSKVAYVVTENNQSAVYINNTPGPLYNSISNGGFSGNSQHYAYVAMNASGTDVVLDRKVIASYPGSFPRVEDGFSISSSGILEYVLTTYASGDDSSPTQDGQEQVVFNGHLGPSYNDIFDDKISPDGQSVVYYGCTNDDENVDDNMQSPGSCDFVIQGLDGTFHPIASTVYSNGVDEAIDHSGIQFSPDGKILVYVAHQTTQDSLVVSGLQTWTTPGSYAVENISNVVFSPDSQHLAYIVQGCDEGDGWCVAGFEDGKWYIVEDNKIVSPEYDEIKDLTFNYDGQLSYFALTSSTWSFIINGRNIATIPSEPNDLPNIQFSQDDKDYLYTYQDASNTILIANGNQIAQAQNGSIFLPQFAPNGEIIFAMVNSSTQTMSLNVGGIVHPAHDLIIPLVLIPNSIYSSFYQYSPDDKNIMYGAVDGQDIKVVVEPI